MSRAGLAALSAMAPSVSRDDEAKEQARLILRNIGVLLDECDDVLTQADRFAVVSTWMPNLERMEWQLQRITEALAASAGLVVED